MPRPFHWDSGMPRATPISGRHMDRTIPKTPSRAAPQGTAPAAGRSYVETARHFCVEDLPGAAIPSARLQKVLAVLWEDKPVTRLSLEFLKQQGLAALHHLAIGGVSYERFRELALAEKAARIEAATAARQAREAAERERVAAMQAKADLLFKRRETERLARESDPGYIAKVRNRELRARYGIHDFVEPDCLGRLMAILNSVDAGRRLGAEDYAWLAKLGRDYLSDELRAAYHRLEAKFYVEQYEQTRDPWAAINASSQLRKCGEAGTADALLSTIDAKAPRPSRLESALATARGGVMRDLGRRDEALRLGERAHALTPDDFRPCTLLGALYMENGDHHAGRDWYRKAVERGAEADSVDQELRRIFFRADFERQEALRAFLLAEDPVRYAWARKASRPSRSESAVSGNR